MSVIAKKEIGEILKDSLISSEMTQLDIAKKIGITKGYMSKFLSGKEIAFWMVIEAVKCILPEKEKELMGDYCKSGIDKKYVFCALEYCYSKQLYDVMRFLIVEYSKTAPEACHIYKWILTHRGSFEIAYINKLHRNEYKSVEARSLVTIIEVYGYYNLGKYDMARLFIEKASDYIDGVKDPFLKKSFSARLDEVLANIYLKQDNNVVKARQYAESLLNSQVSTNHILTANYLFALSYFMESYEKSYFYYCKVLEILEIESQRMDEVFQNREEVAILQHYWFKEIEPQFNITKFTECLSHNDSLSEFYDDPSLRVYAYLFDGIKEKRSDKLLLSLHYFSEKRDYFRANLPKIQLHKLDLDIRI
ncbi:AimR family lysis-lysogeny pheromone receptor (plasmid) [Bacillus altitudinis]|uniref:AimR family lysis-lysogeny pheromone receptor n=1 Tax=Bacillus altitudinis TaxID=293387 RepID=UPI0024A95BF8|nr:AimR family lysis-lysogeny pheromone receptor [Bacillus altitudinis]WHF29092.1 AimR family lysis-lysogeny pheromone receptor [Bacillus altitudinis]